MNAAALPAGLSKECRALAPFWALCLAGMSLSVVAPGGFPEGLIVYVFGLLALGSQSIGHEFSNRTLPLLLSQPVARRRVYWLKATVLVSMVLPVVLAGVLILPGSLRGPGETWMLVLPPLCAVLATPWLTMITRSALAGIVFTVAVPATFALIASLVIGESDAVGITAALALCAVGALDGWRRFTHLEAIDAPAASLQLPESLRRFAARPRHPVWMLVVKELQLQQMTFAIAGLYVVGWVIWSPLLRSTPAAANPLEVLTPIYVLLLMAVMGSLTTAEERDLGTVDWQLLMPLAAWKQWAIKMAVVAGLAALLGVAIPSIVAVSMSRSPGFVNPFVGSLVLLLTAGSIYVSSLCRTAMRAIVTSLVALPLGLSLYLPLLEVMNQLTSSWVGSAFTWRFPPGLLGTPAALTLFIGVTAVLLRYAYVNHRQASPPTDRVVHQLVMILAVLTFGGMAAVFVAVRAV